MGSITITRNGTKRNYNLSYLDWTKAQAANTANSGVTSLGDLIFTHENALCEGTLTGVLPDGANNKFYIFKSANFPNSLIRGYTPISEQGSSRVLYFDAMQKSGDTINDFFPPAPDDDKPPLNTTIDITNPANLRWWGRIGFTSSYYGPVYQTGNNVDEIFINENALGYFETQAGCNFGASMDMIGGNNYGVTTGIQIHSYGAYKYLSDNFTPTLTGNQAFGGKPWGPYYDGQLIIPYPSNEVAYNAYAKSAVDWSIMPQDVAIADIGDDVTAEFVATSINNVLYAGLAACRWEGSRIVTLQVTLLPAWFWDPESMQLDWDFDTPDIDDAWFGPEVPSNPGIGGSYSYTQQPASDISLPSTTIYDFYTQGVAGTHIYMVNGPCVSQLIDQFWNLTWGDNAKQYINQGIVAAHQIPHGLLPVNNPNNAVSRISVAGANVMVPPGGLAQIVNPYTQKTIGTFIGATKADPLFPVLDCYLDYEPYTTVSLILPFAGSVEIPASQCIGGSITVTANCNCVTGDVVYEIKCISGAKIKDSAGKPLKNHYYATGNCAVSIPLTGALTGERQRMSDIFTAIGGAGTLAAGLALATNPVAAGAVSSLIPAGSIAAIAHGVGGIANGISGAVDPQRSVLNAGGIAGSPADLGSKQVIMRVTRPKKAYEDGWLTLGGIRSELDATLSEFASTYSNTFVKVKYCNIDTINATNSEKNEIEALIKDGVYL